jgi:hypothetical protein
MIVMLDSELSRNVRAVPQTLELRFRGTGDGNRVSDRRPVEAQDREIPATSISC